MQITWLGHSCFCLEEAGYALVLDPYTGVPGYPPLQVQGNNLLCSHDHFDHSHIGGVILLPPAQSPFDIRTVETFHDTCQGAQRGGNTIHLLTAGGVTVGHLGDLGHPLTEAQLQELGTVDVLLVPVGGTYTVDAAAALGVVQSVGARLVVPMHYRHGAYGLQEVDTVEPFLAQFPADQVTRLSGNSFTLSAGDGKSGVFLLHYPA